MKSILYNLDVLWYSEAKWNNRNRFSYAYICGNKLYPVLCPKLTLIQPTWSAYPYHLVFIIWHPYSLVFLIWYPYALISLYGNTAHCSGYSVAMGCYGLSIVPSQLYDRYCFTGYARTWARHPTTPWQREFTAITSIDSLLASMRFVTHFWEITHISIEGRNCRLSTVPGLFNESFGLRPSHTLIRVVELVARLRARLATSCARGQASLC